MLKEYLQSAHLFSQLSEQAKNIVRYHIMQLDIDTIEHEWEDINQHIGSYSYMKWNLKRYNWNRQNYVNVQRNSITDACPEGEILINIFEGSVINQIKDETEKKIPAVIAKRILDEWEDARRRRNEGKYKIVDEWYYDF